MEQQISLTAFIKDFLWNNFWHINGIAWLLIILFILFSFFWVKSIINKELSTPSKFAPSVMTAAGLLGTFIGLTFGLKDLNLQEQASMQELINGLKLVFVYSLVGVFSAILFMLLNMIPTAMQNRKIKIRSDQIKQDAKAHNQHIISLQKNQTDALNHLIELQGQQLDNQKLMQQDIAKLQFDNNNEELGRIITQGIVNGLSPLLMEIKTAVADQGTEAIKKVLEDLKDTILIPMKGALDNTNNALETTNQAVKATIIAIEESQKHNNKLIAAVETAAIKMESASDKMNGLVDKIDNTVQTMDEMQKRQEESFTQFNQDLQGNLGRIQPAIESGMKVAETSLVNAINETSQAMQRDVKQVLVDTTSELKTTIGVATDGMVTASQEMQKLVGKIDDTVQHMDDIQKEQKESLDHFNEKLEINLNKIQPAIEKGLETASKSLTNAIESASELMEKSIKDASNEMQANIQIASREMVSNIDSACGNMTTTITETLKISGEELVKSVNEATTELNKSVTATIEKQNESINQSFKNFDNAQEKFDRILVDFSGRMDGHITNMATTLKEIGDNAESMINSASENLKNTLGNIDTKLKDSSDFIQKELTVFREEYQKNLTEYLQEQNKRLDGFLADQNKQLEQTIGEQRKGLEAVTEQLKTQFEEMCEQQGKINKSHTQLINIISSTETSILAKVQTIALELKQGEEKLSRELSQSSKHLTTVSQALENMGHDLPEEFANAFKELDKTYKDAFEDLDSGLKHAVNNLRGAVAALAAAIPLHDAMNQH